jgi:hypothetical protein
MLKKLSNRSHVKPELVSLKVERPLIFECTIASAKQMLLKRNKNKNKKSFLNL